MKENIVKNKSMEFAIRIIKLNKFLVNKWEFVISKQILKSWTSIWANIAESEYAESKVDFIHKLSISQKEANETLYWLELLQKTNYLPNKLFESLKNDLTEIQKLLTSIIKSTKNN